MTPEPNIPALTERIAAALFEYATWHPPEPGRNWFSISERAKESWREEARALLDEPDE